MGREHTNKAGRRIEKGREGRVEGRVKEARENSQIEGGESEK